MVPGAAAASRRCATLIAWPGDHVEFAALARGDEALVDPGAEGEALGLETEAGARGLALGLDPREEFEGGVDCPRGIVLVELGHPEDGHQRVADVFLDEAPVGFDELLEYAEDPRHEGVHLLRVVALGEAREALHVGEEDGGGTPLAGLYVIALCHRPFSVPAGERGGKRRARAGAVGL